MIFSFGGGGGTRVPSYRLCGRNLTLARRPGQTSHLAFVSSGRGALFCVPRAHPSPASRRVKPSGPLAHERANKGLKTASADEPANQRHEPLAGGGAACRQVSRVTRWKLYRHKFSSCSLLGNDEMPAFGLGPQGEESVPLSRPQASRRWTPCVC